MGAKVVICITTYNEQETIYDLCRELVLAGYDVIVSDGGSTDKTARRAKVAGATVLESHWRIGIRPAMMKAFQLAWNLERYDRYVQMDAGGSHSPADLPHLLSAEAHVVVGSRFLVRSGYRGRKWRSWMSRVASWACNRVFDGAPIWDWTSGYRVYSHYAMAHITLQRYSSFMHGWQIESLLKLAANGYIIKEVPITYRAGRSSFNLDVALEAFREWWPYFRKGYK